MGNFEVRTPKRGRPAMTNEKKVEMRRRISSVASDLFKAEGFGTVSMRRIAKEIGCAPMSIYKYYDSKIALLRSLWAGVFNDLFLTLSEISEMDDPRDYLLELGTQYVDFWLERPDSYRLVFMAEGVSQPDVSLFLDNPEIIEKFGIFLRAIKSASTGDISDETLKLRFDVFLSALHGMTHNHVTISGYPWSEPREQIEVLIQALCVVK